MNNVFVTLVYLFFGYIVGLWLAAPGLFSATVSLTTWSNIWVYVWLLFWPFMLLWHFIIWVLIICAVLFVAYLILEKILG